jgi:gamma-D-glutamyl-L-lysine dipeptidyl-peptidase
MSGGRPSSALVRQAVLDVRRRPDHRSELTNQLLLGEGVKVRRARGPAGWQAIEGLEDGYRGWVRDWGLERVTPAALARWRREARVRVAVPMALLRDRPGRGGSLGPLPWMARLRLVARRGAWAQVALPGGRIGWTPRSALRGAREVPGSPIERVRALLGAPYLWGGRTVLGIDCSGLTQLIAAEQGWALPRDAHDQWRASRRLRDADPLRPGDLVFFSTRPRGRVEHVGVYAGEGAYLHARGVVRMNSLDPSNTLFDKELAVQLRGFGRAPSPAAARSAMV